MKRQKAVAAIGLSLIVLTLAILFYAIFQQWQFTVRLKSFAALPDYDSVVKFDPRREGGHLLPNLNMLVKGARFDKPVRFITNSKGFRSDHEYTYEPLPGIFRILLLGDSFVDGYRTDQEDTIGRNLEKFLGGKLGATHYRAIEVLIAGNNNPANAWYYYQEHGHKYKPNLVILGVTLGNDLTWHNFRGGLIPAANGTLALRSPSGVGQDERQKPTLMLPSQAFVPPSFWDIPSRYGFRLRKYLAGRADLFEYSVPPVTHPCKSARRLVCAADFSTSLGLFYLPIMPDIEEMFEDFEAVLAGMSHRVLEDKVSFLATMFPSRFQVYSHEWALLRSSYLLKDDMFNLNYPNDRFRNYCGVKHIHCLDLLERSRSENRERLYFPLGDMHFNERGQELASRSIGEYVLDQFIRKIS